MNDTHQKKNFTEKEEEEQENKITHAEYILSLCVMYEHKKKYHKNFIMFLGSWIISFAQDI